MVQSGKWKRKRLDLCGNGSPLMKEGEGGSGLGRIWFWETGSGSKIECFYM